MLIVAVINVYLGFRVATTNFNASKTWVIGDKNRHPAAI